jgi:chromosome segregation ATPase
MGLAMHRFESFRDLRSDARHQISEATLWPTFTDIMTVILMIFMLTMIIVIIKNTNLSDQLRFSQERKQQVEESLRESQQIVANFKDNITNLEESLRTKEMEIILLTDEAKLLKSNLESKLAIVSALKNQISDLNQKVVMLQATVASKEAEALNLKEASAAEIQRMKEASQAEILRLKEASEEEIARLTEETRRQIEAFNHKMMVLLGQLQEKEAVLVALDSERKDLELALAKQRSDYSELEEKYIRLIRPARSPLGREVVSVHYSRLDGKYKILFKDIDAAQFEQINPQQLHDRLGKLKEKLKDKLYVKIVIPEESGLSYNEAWSFTREILSKYDYYYQEAPAAD